MIYTWIFLFLLEVGMGYNIGPLPISEYFLYGYVALNFRKFTSIFIKGSLRFLYKAIISIICIQLFIDIIIYHLDIFYILKGTDTLLMFMLHTFVLYEFITKDKKNLVPILLGACFMTFHSAQTLMEIEYSDDAYSSAMEGEDAPLLKFIIAPILTYIFMGFLVLKNKRIMVLLSVFIGCMLIVLGARNSGLTFILAAFFYFFSFSKLLKKRLKIFIIISLLLGYGGYAFYVNKVLSGQITSGNNDQILQLKNPYNPVSLIIYGRPEVYVEIIATLDSPIYGYSTHPLDTTGKYRALRRQLKGGYFVVIPDPRATIPGHSIIFDIGLFYGFFALLIFVRVIIRILILMFKYIMNGEKESRFLVSFFFAFLLWNLLFSPIGQLKWTIPIYFAAFLSLYYKKSKQVVMTKKYCNE